MGFEYIDCDVLVLGCGLAGAIASLEAADQGLNVAVLEFGEGSTSYAQGGIVYKGEGDPDSLIDDVLEAGCYINNKAAVEHVVKNGPPLVDSWLREKFSVQFDRTENTESYHLALEAAHKVRRILHVQDQTGKKIVDAFKKKILNHPHIHRLHGSILDLIVSTKHCVDSQKIYDPPHVLGAYVLLSDLRVVALSAKATVLATGGFSALYQFSTGPKNAIGAGIAAAHRAGARVLHLEFTQFHPTALLVSEEPKVLITEALRGEGALIVKENGERFAESLAPRDVLSRAMHDALVEGDHVRLFLDIRSVKNIESKFPSLMRALEEFNIDHQAGFLPIVPAAHYSIGGVWTDLNARTNLKGLWACGEVACTGLHGANRLASMSLLEALVFGSEAGRDAACFAKNLKVKTPKVKAWIEGTEDVDSTLLQQDWSSLRKTMWNYVGLVRTPRRLDRAERLLGDLRKDVESFYRNGVLTHDLVALRHAVLTATLCLYAAKHNRSSIGSHFLRFE